MFIFQKDFALESFQLRDILPATRLELHLAMRGEICGRRGFLSKDVHVGSCGHSPWRFAYASDGPGAC
jgi:hypothetical protein